MFISIIAKLMPLLLLICAAPSVVSVGGRAARPAACSKVAAPCGLTATAGRGRVRLRWRASTRHVRVAGYGVWRRNDHGSTWATIGRTHATNYTDAGVVPGKSYAYKVRAFDAAGNVSAWSAVVATTVRSGPVDTGATGYRQLVKPRFRPTSRVTARTQAQFVTDLARLKAGEELDVRPMVLAGSFRVTKALSSYAEIHFAPGVVFSGAAAYKYYTVQISDSSNLRIYGGDVTNPANGACVRIDSSTNVVWWHFKIHDCAATGLFATSIDSASAGIDLDGEIDHVAYAPNRFDPHIEKCTGIHGAYLGGDPSLSLSGKFSLHVHDSECGAAVQVGSNVVNTELWVTADDIPYEAKHQAAGNAIQFWGTGLHNITVHDVVGQDLAGRVVEAGGLYSCCNSGIVVQYGRGRDTLRNPLLSRVDYYPNPAITYENVGAWP